METIVIKLGGSILVPDKINISYLKKFKKMIKHQKKQFIIIVGGGKLARRYQNAAKKFKISSEDLDWLGIQATKVNARLVADALGGKFAEKPCPIKDKITVAGGWKPGNSTDYVAVRFAKINKATKLINASDIDYIYDKDPNKYKTAKKFEEMSWAELKKITGTEWKPGMNVPFDPKAVKEASGLKMYTTSKDIENIRNIIQDKDFKGTSVK